MNFRSLPLAAALLYAGADTAIAQPLPDDPAPPAGATQTDGTENSQAGAPAAATPEDVAALRAEMATLRKELRDALAAQKAAAADGSKETDLSQTIASIDGRLAKLERTVDTLVQNQADLAADVARSGESDGARVLANLNTDPAMRKTIVQAANPKAAVRLYNWYDTPKRVQVNGAWYNVNGRGADRTVYVPYGPVAITHCEKQEPVSFADWTQTDGGYVMVFDLNPRNDAR